MQAQSVQSKAQIRELLLQFGPHLDSDWATKLWMYLKSNDINELALLSPECDYQRLKDYADSEEEATAVFAFLDIVRSNRKETVATAPPPPESFPSFNSQPNLSASMMPSGPAFLYQPNPMAWQFYRYHQGQPVPPGQETPLQSDPKAWQHPGYQASPQQTDPSAWRHPGHPSGPQFSVGCQPFPHGTGSEFYYYSMPQHLHQQQFQYPLGQPTDTYLQWQAQGGTEGFQESRSSELSRKNPTSDQQQTPGNSESLEDSTTPKSADEKYQQPEVQIRGEQKGRLYPIIDRAKSLREDPVMKSDDPILISFSFIDISDPANKLNNEPDAVKTASASSVKPRSKKTFFQRLKSMVDKKDPTADEKETEKQPAAKYVSDNCDSARSSRVSTKTPKGLLKSFRRDTKSSEGRNRERSVLSELSLNDFFPEKIRLSQLLKIVGEKQIEQPAEAEKQRSTFKMFLRKSFPTRRKRDNNFAFNLLRGLMSFDGTVRDLVPQSKSSEELSITSRLLEGADGDDSDDALNPIDILITCYQCCNKELQQILCRILFTCKLAFPLIYNNGKSLIISQWSLRDIVLEYRSRDDSFISKGLVSDQPIKVVSFVRIGELPESKSHLLNQLLNGNYHATFFHRDCTGGHIKRVCSNGLVEATVVLPVAARQTFEDPFLAANLRGNLLQFSPQGVVLTEISQVMVIFINVLNLADPTCFTLLQKLEKNLKLLLVLYRTEGVQISESVFSNEIEAFIERNSAVLAYSKQGKRSEKELCSDLERLLSQHIGKCDGIKLDTLDIQITKSDECGTVSDAKALAAKVMKHFVDKKISEFKRKHLPLQSPWLEYSRLYKVENSAKAVQSEQLKSQACRMEKRAEQLKNCEKLSKFIVAFSEALQKSKSVEDGELASKLLLQWMKLTFENASRLLEPQLQRNVDEIREQSQTGGSDLARILADVEKTNMESSAGIENVFREVGQIFEAARENPRHVKSSLLKFVEPLPKLFAQLLLWGVSLEIFDGDAGNIPSAWISAILKSCQELVGRKKIYVISVLGLQSSGKSTLLNTMFGLKFAVSAGRCTRGAFLQLVPVESGMPYDYIAVLDTEGLRAPELGLEKYYHDNELATLVIGLGDVTIINLKGENAAEMKDILQIVIHAFIRMKMANRMRDLHRHCIFIHQNVPAVGAKEQLKFAAVKMQHTLDAITREAAKGEGLRNVNRFSDIISFEKESDIFYMSDLWQGDPPMAPINPGYSQKVLAIKDYLLHVLEGTSHKKHFLNFQDFSCRINELWKAILSEDFVFSFKSSIELKAYSQMEAEFFEAKNTIEQATDEWLNREASIQIKRCNDATEISSIRDKNLHDLNDLVGRHMATVQARLEKFFEEGQYNEYTIQWKERKLIALQNFAQELKQEIRRKLSIMTERHKADTEREPKRAELERRIIAKARHHANQLREKNSETTLIRLEFENEWATFMNDLPTQSADGTQCIETQIYASLEEQYENNIKFLRDYLDRTPISCPLKDGKIDITIDFFNEEGENAPKLIQIQPSPLQVVKQKAKQALPSKNSNDADHQVKIEVLSSCSEILSFVHPRISDMKKQTTGFQRQFAVTIQKTIRDGINQLINDRLGDRGISSTPALEIKLVIHALRFAYPAFIELDKKFHEGQSLKAMLELSKYQMWNLFENIVRQHNNSKIAADLCRDHLAVVIKDAIDARMQRILKRRVITEIGNTKYQLIAAILTDGARKNDFALIFDYCQNSYNSALKWVTSYSEGLLFAHKPSGSGSLFGQLIQCELVDPIIKSVKTAAEHAARASPTINQWIDGFCKAVAREIAVLPQNLRSCMSQFQLYNTDSMMAPLMEGLDALRSELYSLYNSFDKRSIQWHGESTLYADVLETLWGCQEQCPFCNEPCQKADPNHFENDGSSHCCIQHRPKAVRGAYDASNNEFVFDTCQHSVISGNQFNCSLCKLKGKRSEFCSSDASGHERLNVSHPFKEYKKQFPDWDITPDAANDSSKFWMWFCWTFQSELQDKWQRGLGNIPPAWQAVSKEEAISSLSGL